MYEMFNEGEWYNQKDLRAFQSHFLSFFKSRTSRLLVVNDDHVGGRGFRDDAKADLISLHKPRWDDLPPARTFFEHYESHFYASPIKPVLFSEPVPEFSGIFGSSGAPPSGSFMVNRTSYLRIAILLPSWRVRLAAPVDS
jgi:hypothetical protein